MARNALNELDPPAETSSTVASEPYSNSAGDNYFLRYLTLDEEPWNSDLPFNGSRRQSLNKKPLGRTLFTITKRLQRPSNSDFGFYFNWTQPPLIESVEPNSPAALSGILSGDYLVFIGNQNCVTYGKEDILNLIDKQEVLILEIFRRSASKQANNNFLPYTRNNGEDVAASTKSNSSFKKQSSAGESAIGKLASNLAKFSLTTTTSTSIETAKKRLQLVTFSKESILPHSIDNQRRKHLCHLIQCEQNFINSVGYGFERFVEPLKARQDLLTFTEHETLFQNIEDIRTISLNIIEQILQNEVYINTVADIYLRGLSLIRSAYKKYCYGLKAANVVLMKKSHSSNHEFMRFIAEPPIPRKCPDIVTFIHKPLHHFRQILRDFQLLASSCHLESRDYNHLQGIINELQIAYREIITVNGMGFEPISNDNVRPLLTLQDLDSRLVFTKCKPFKLALNGRQWIFGGDLIKVENNQQEKPSWTLLFSDILLFAKISRDRVLFITDEPILLANISESCFNVRKKITEFRLTVEPNRSAESPTIHCGPDLTSRSPMRLFRRKCIVLRAPTVEMKAVWQNLLTRQIFNVNSTPLNTSPLDSPNIAEVFPPPKSSYDSLNNQRSHNHEPASSENYRSSGIFSQYKYNFRSISTIGSIPELPESSTKYSNPPDEKTDDSKCSNHKIASSRHSSQNSGGTNSFNFRKLADKMVLQQKAFDAKEHLEERAEDMAAYSLINTPETPSANLSLSLTNPQEYTPSSSIPASILNISPNSVARSRNFNGSWDDDMVEFGINFNDLNCDSSLGNLTSECLFFKDDPFCVNPPSTSSANAFDL